MNGHNKGYILLSMYDALRAGKSLRISECLVDYKISIATFRRYLALLRVFFADAHGQDIAYCPSQCAYKVVAESYE